MRDSDGDWLDDREELRHGTDPNDRDSDDDGLRDGTEVRRSNTDPLDADTDDDGVDDGTEFRRDTNRVNVGDRRQPVENREPAGDQTTSGVSDEVDVASAASDDSFEPITIFRPELDDRPDEVVDLGHTDDAEIADAPSDDDCVDDLDFGSGSRATTLDEIVDPVGEPAFGAGAADELALAASGGDQTWEIETSDVPVVDVAPTGSVEEVTGRDEAELQTIGASEPVDHQELPEEEEEPPSSLLPEDLEEHSLAIQEGDSSLDSVEVLELG
mgnify:FL=1